MVESQIIDSASPEWQIGVLRSIECDMPKKVRKNTPNWKMVQDYLLGHTAKGGSTSCRIHCRFLGVDPDGYTFWDAAAKTIGVVIPPMLWCIHIEGPDDIIAMRTKEKAETEAAKINAFLKRQPVFDDDPHCEAKVVPYPGSAENHAREVDKNEREEAVRP